ncbi:uncharacterized protein LOC106166018 [Lingula anatina]|uniref:Uncharacterized protein LOC106166018 n=1 Tax=Lingula anatina TaxID=7574 RepID=A0A1S3INP9_LINAN|nr:uncharacterized protein LOC106166018 [Lingula anatina]|eukprot:XP_013399870.1 uncharacterized protein LOC106166018 [Lingula anatina]
MARRWNSRLFLLTVFLAVLVLTVLGYKEACIANSPRSSYVNIVPVTEAAYNASFGVGTVQAKNPGHCGLFCLQNRACVTALFNRKSGDCNLMLETLHDMLFRESSVMSAANATDWFLVNIRNTGDESPKQPVDSEPCDSDRCSTGKCRATCDGQEAHCVGDNSQCPEHPVDNLRYYHLGVLNLNYDSPGKGIVANISYTKKHSFTALRVQWSGSLRGPYNTAGGCVRWYFKFNNMECGNPDTIEYMHHDNAATDLHRRGHMDGMCEGIPEGVVNIQMHQGNCFGFPLSTGYVGHHDESFIMVQEVDTRYSSASRTFDLPNQSPKFTTLYFPGSSASHYATIAVTLPDLNEVTVCYWQKMSSYAQTAMATFSYASSAVFNAFTIWIQSSGTILLSVLNTDSEVNWNSLTDNMWHQVCGMWRSSDGYWAVYVDSREAGSGTGLQTGQTIAGGGMIILGQDQDSLGGGFAATQSFTGYMTRINIWDVVLQPHGMGQCYSSTYGNVFAFDGANDIFLAGSVSTSADQDICLDQMIPTWGGNSGGAACFWPFTYKGQPQNLCLVDEEGRSRPWCGTTADYDADGLWGYCTVAGHGKGHNTDVIYTYGGSANGQICQFPFVYGGITYTACTAHGNSYAHPWCYAADGTWGYCITSEPMYALRTGSDCGGNDIISFSLNNYQECLDACSLRPDCLAIAYRPSDHYCWLKYKSCVSPSSSSDRWMLEKFIRDPIRKTFGGNSEGMACVLPFIYQDTVYHSCITVNHNQPWCATTTNYDLDGRWGNCLVLTSSYGEWKEADCSGNDIGTVHYRLVSGVDECESQCRLTGECRLAMYQAYSNNCWRKKFSCPSGSGWTYVKHSELVRTGKYYLRRYGSCAGGDISNAAVSSTYEECIWTCNAMKDCKSFYYDKSNSMCYPKNIQCAIIDTSCGTNCYVDTKIYPGKDFHRYESIPPRTVWQWRSLSTSKYAILSNHATPDLTEFTACYWGRSDYYDSSTWLSTVSYANSQTDNGILIMYRAASAGIRLHINSPYTDIDTMTNDNNWHHICLTWKSANGEWALYSDGLLLKTSTGLASGTTIAGGGTWILGQDQDCVGGCFSTSQAYVGYLTGVNVWDKVLDITAMGQTCQSELKGNVLSWQEILDTAVQHNIQSHKEDICGELALPSPCGAHSVINVQQHTVHNLNKGDNTGDVELMFIDYVKREEDTAVRVKWEGTLWLKGDTSKRWYVLFLINARKNDAFYLEGICEGIPAGKVRIRLLIGESRSSVNEVETGEANTGWLAVSRFMVEEIRMGHDIDAFEGSDGVMYQVPVFNIQQFYWDIQADTTDNGLLKSATYKKKSSLSTLRVKLIGDFDTPGGLCAKFYFKFNGQECTNPASIFVRTYTNPLMSDLRTFPIEGICKGLQSGDIVIDLYATNSCADVGFSGGPDITSGSRSNTRLIVEELHLSE